MERDTSSTSSRPIGHIEAESSAGKREGASLAHGEPEGDFFARLDAARERLGIKAMPPEEARAFRAALHDSALSRRVLGVDDD